MRYGFSILFLIGLVALLIFGASIRDYQPPPPIRKVSPELEAKVRRDLAREEIANNVRVATVWNVGDSIMIATFVFRNMNNVPVKDVEVTCSHYGASGTLLGTAAKRIYEALPPGETTVPNFNMGYIDTQSRRVNCQVTNTG